MARGHVLPLLFLKNNFIDLFVFDCAEFLCAACGLSLVVASRGYPLVVVCVGFSLWWLLLLWSTGSRVHGL